MESHHHHHLLLIPIHIHRVALWDHLFYCHPRRHCNGLYHYSVVIKRTPGHSAGQPACEQVPKWACIVWEEVINKFLINWWSKCSYKDRERNRILKCCIHEAIHSGFRCTGSGQSRGLSCVALFICSTWIEYTRERPGEFRRSTTTIGASIYKWSEWSVDCNEETFLLLHFAAEWLAVPFTSKGQ